MGCGAAFASPATLRRLRGDLKECQEESASLYLRLRNSEQAVRSSESSAAELQHRMLLLQEGWERDNSELLKREADALRQSQEALLHKEQALRRSWKAEVSEHSLARELAAAEDQRLQVAECLEMAASNSLLRQSQELALESATSKRLSEQLLAWRDEGSEAAAKGLREAQRLRGQRASLREEYDQELETVRQVREQLWSEQAEMISKERQLTSLRIELSGLFEHEVLAEKRFMDLEVRAESETRRFLSERSQALRERDTALLARDEASLGWNEAVALRDAALRRCDEASRALDDEHSQAKSRVDSLRLLADDAQMQLRAERDHARLLQEEVGQCARSGAARAAASYLGCRPTSSLASAAASRATW